MIGATKKYYWELFHFKQCDSLLFTDMKVGDTKFLYLFKKNFPEIAVRLYNPVEKIHGWTFTDIEIVQKMNNNPRLYHWKSTRFDFRGELILTSMKDFNKRVIEEIEEMLPKRTIHLQNWMEADLSEVFEINSKSKEDFGGEHAFIEVRALCHNRYINYFELRSWRSTTWEGLLQMAEQQKITKNSSIGELLEEIEHFIMSFQVIRQERYQNMFYLHQKKKSPKKNMLTDDYQKNYEKKILMKYHLYEYIQDE